MDQMILFDLKQNDECIDGRRKEIPMEKSWIKNIMDGYIRITNSDGPNLGYSQDSGVTIITEEGLAFKDLNKNGKLDPYEDWRLPVEERAKDLASRLSLEEIAGLMLYSAHQMIPATTAFGPLPTYGGKPFTEADVEAWALTDQQKKFLTEDHLRHILMVVIQDAETGARWNNNVQALSESIGHGIPANNSTDPRHGADDTKEFNMGGGVSQWPEHLGLASTFDPAVVKSFGEVASAEYRALGITTALSPQVDLATDPRWGRFNGTFGEDVKLSTDMARAYCDGFQTTEASDDGWGLRSVNAMVKHWPGGGSGEGGRDAHFDYGQYAVYPGGNYEEHMLPFLNGAFKLEGGTEMASAVMPYYTISYDMDKVNNENVGNSFSSYIINDLLRDKYGYDGVVCTDWLITKDNGPAVETFSGKCWGTEDLTEAQRHYKVLMAGCDQFGGNNEIEPILEAYRIGVTEHGESFMRSRFEQSAVRLLKNIFRVGLFENPYLDVEDSNKTVMHEDYMKAGFEAQLKSLVMVKNKASVLPLKPKTKVYMPKRYTKELQGWMGMSFPEKTVDPLDRNILAEYFEMVDTPEQADVALVAARGPMNFMMASGYDPADVSAGGNGYVPISLQYRPYTSEYARETSIAGGGSLENFTNRSYKGKTVTVPNESDLDMILDTKAAMGDKPVITLLQLERPCVVSEFESYVDGLIIDFGVSAKAICEVLSGTTEPSGLLPLQMPTDMKTVEEQYEDVAHDMRCHSDSEGNIYNFGFGLNYSGVIKDWRTDRYCK